MTPRKKDRSLDNTVKLEMVLFNKERIKFWTLMLSVAAGIYASAMSTLTNNRGAKEESLKELVRQVNEVVLPDIQKELELLRADNVVLHERLASCEIYRDLIREIQKDMKLPVTGGKGKENKEAQAAALMKLAPPEELFSKKPLPRLNIGQKEVE